MGDMGMWGLVLAQPLPRTHTHHKQTTTPYCKPR